MRTLVTGATGFLGRALVQRLGRAVVLARSPERARAALGDVEVHAWDAVRSPPPPEALDGVEVVFNLAGEPVAGGRWTADRRRLIRDSRVLGTRHLVAGLAAGGRPPRVLVSASAVGYYGDRGEEVLDEASPRGSGFLADVCAEWEAEARTAERLGVRVVCVRTGLVLAPGGGTLARLLPIFRWGAGGRLGDGRQWMPWIHLDDELELLSRAARDEGLRGPLNAVAPEPVTNAEFTRALARAVGRPALLPVPGTVLRVALGELSGLLTASQRVRPAAAERAGHAFLHPRLEGALAASVRTG